LHRITATLPALNGAGLLSRATALRSIADIYGVDDIDAEMARIDVESEPRH
jgi:hypothetical protein